jgi:hypothetical protein
MLEEILWAIVFTSHVLTQSQQQFIIIKYCYLKLLIKIKMYLLIEHLERKLEKSCFFNENRTIICLEVNFVKNN